MNDTPAKHNVSDRPPQGEQKKETYALQVHFVDEVLSKLVDG
jgi:hypothetical protein